MPLSQKRHFLRRDMLAEWTGTTLSDTSERNAVIDFIVDRILKPFGGCLAAGRGFIHLADDGSLEACPFAPFSDVNAAQVGLAAALDSPLMRAIRARHNELTETKGGCALWNKKGWVATLGACAGRKAS